MSKKRRIIPYKGPLTLTGNEGACHAAAGRGARGDRVRGGLAADAEMGMNAPDPDDDGGPMTLTGRALLERIDKELAYVGRLKTRALLRELRRHLCKLERDVWAAEVSLDLDSCIIGELRESARRVTGGNCGFADDDLSLLTTLAERAVGAGLTKALHRSVLKNIAAKQKAAPKKQARKP